MPRENEIHYRDLLKVEFKDMLARLLEERDHYHMYSIGRLCTQGTMVGFDYGYYPIVDEPDVVGKYLDLKEYGRIDFSIDCVTGYGTVMDIKESETIIKNFLEQFSVDSDITSYRRDTIT